MSSHPPPLTESERVDLRLTIAYAIDGWQATRKPLSYIEILTALEKLRHELTEKMIGR